MPFHAGKNMLLSSNTARGNTRKVCANPSHGPRSTRLSVFTIAGDNLCKTILGYVSKNAVISVKTKENSLRKIVAAFKKRLKETKRARFVHPSPDLQPKAPKDQQTKEVSAS